MKKARYTQFHTKHFPVELKTALSTQAEAEGISMTALVTVMLREGLTKRARIFKKGGIWDGEKQEWG